ncbi:unnamed protein product [Adineta steineri]|uniref:G-protein coupled receptors family 1 profile domain-containing protein n=1 Tax=Adineta steineri TaxID=433720 RepID=A0A814TPN1_9BILA|nr:unnamed protein product [Adineta steineri]CAF3935089.1 unnamed protein product [Adineta steineri]
MENITGLTINDVNNNVTDIIQIFLFTFIIIVSNIYIILVLSKRTLRSAKFTWLTVNVCFASVIFAIMQLLSIGIRLNNIPDTSVSCHSKGFIIDMATCHIMYSHCISSLCRLFSIKYPHKPFFKSSRWLLINIGMSWFIGIFMALPLLFFDNFTCSGNYGKRFLQIYTSFSTILIPVVIVALCNIAIFRYVRQSTKRIRSISENQTNTNQLSQRDRRLCNIMLLTFCVFVIGWIPLFIEQVFFTSGNRLNSGLIITFQILPPICLLADVIVIVYSDQPVRNVFLNVFKRH